jgi:hypothetical protein
MTYLFSLVVAKTKKTVKSAQYNFLTHILPPFLLLINQIKTGQGNPCRKAAAKPRPV